MTGAPSLPTAIESVRLGITDYLLKPVKYEDLLSSVRRALGRRTARRHRLGLVTAKSAQCEDFPEIVGESPPLQELFEIIERVADTDANVLITGESGTGKEVVARAIHRRSPRSEGVFQVIDCTAIPETLFESVLFGHAKGAFTGAVKDQAGLLCESDSGTAFFDEIGELPAALQAKLLRVIQEQTFTPVGKTAPVRVDTRFICATNRDLEMEVNTGRFRRDLYYRLAVIHIELAPLRQRGDDVLLLAHHFLQQLRRPGQPIKTFSADSQALLRRYSWPGNIRELRNTVERGLAMARSELIAPADLPPTIQHASADAQSLRITRRTANLSRRGFTECGPRIFCRSAARKLRQCRSLRAEGRPFSTGAAQAAQKALHRCRRLSPLAAHCQLAATVSTGP